MDTRTNHLVAPELYQELKKLAPGSAQHYEEVPEKLSRAARRALGGKQQVTISKTSGGVLSKWAAQKRASRRAMEKATKRAQRKGGR